MFTRVVLVHEPACEDLL